ncbi:major facilitator superfamily domain-containing protein [Kockiozyma suomiensis]|uniref:major facilitator superfamily domain-containing protein n=1 Tax=Kockiozyma suomiensis TaxID=1337062 RepID=UPI00334406AD
MANSTDDEPISLQMPGDGQLFEKDSKSLSDVERKSYASCEQKRVDADIVTWDGPDDKTNPMNFSQIRKISVIATVSSLTFVVPLASSMFAPGVPDLMVEFHFTSSILSSFVVSIYVLGFAVGPLVIAPMSEMYGRSIIYRISTVLFTGLTIGCGECHSLAAMFILRFLCGTVGSASLALGSGSVADVIAVEHRGRYMSFYIMGPVLGPAVGPVIGGFLTAVSWRWVFRLIAILSGVMCVLCFLTLPETYGPFILKQKAKRLRKETGNDNLHTIFENRAESPKVMFTRNIIRPLKLLILSPIVLILSLFVAVTYGELYLLFTTFTRVFEDSYGFSTEIVGLSYLGLGFGSMSAIMIMILYQDRILVALADRTPSKERKPEHRLPLMIILSPAIVIGLIIYGWSSKYQVHWIVPMIGTYFIGVGILATLSPTMNYLVDAYGIYAASAASASTMVRSLGGAFLPLAGESMYDALGLGWGNTLLAFIVLILLPVPISLYYHGESLRKRFSPNLD